MRILIKHVGALGDSIFFLPPIIHTYRKKYPQAQITLLIAWGPRDKEGCFHSRGFDGFTLNLMMTNPEIDELAHYSDRKQSLRKEICIEEGVRFATWNKTILEKKKKEYDLFFEADLGVPHIDDPLQFLYKKYHLKSDFTNYKIYTTQSDKLIVDQIIKNYSCPRILICEGIEAETMRGWSREQTEELIKKIKKELGVSPVWFGSKNILDYFGKKINIRQSAEFASRFDIAIGVLSATMHICAGVGVQTITLYGGMPKKRGAPEYFLNKYIKDQNKRHVTIMAPECDTHCFLKKENGPCVLSPNNSLWQSWQKPGNQKIKNCLVKISVEDVFRILKNILKVRNLI